MTSNLSVKHHLVVFSTLAIVFFSLSVVTPSSATDRELAKEKLPPLPEAVASFGGAVHDGWLYVYGGHTGTAHEHSLENLSQHFCRLQLSGGKAWEALPLEEPLQGVPLVAYGKSLYRVGGMFAKNKADEDDDLHGVDHFSRFDIQKKEWFAMPSLPQIRSSHDAVVLGDQLYVAGGWRLQGKQKSEWHSKSLVFDLSEGDQGRWLELPEQPFQRRALTTSHWHGKLAVIGGIEFEGKVSRKLDLYDPATKSWSQGPELPGTRMSGFGVSAWNSGGKLLVSGLDGILHQLTEDGKAWQEAGKLKTARFFHRLLPAGKGRMLPAGKERLLVVGGASFGSGHLDDVEFLSWSAQGAKVDEAKADATKLEEAAAKPVRLQ